MEREVNFKHIDEICSGNDLLKVNLIEIFLEETPKMITQIKDSIELENFRRVEQVAHKIKSSMAMFGMDSIVEDVKKIELNARNHTNTLQSKKMIINIINRLEIAYNELRNQL